MLHEHAMVRQELVGDVPELVGRLPQDHAQEHEAGAQLLGDHRLVLVGEPRPVALEHGQADREVTRFVLTDLLKIPLKSGCVAFFDMPKNSVDDATSPIMNDVNSTLSGYFASDAE